MTLIIGLGNVCKIGDTGYETIDEAVTAATAGQTIVLTKDVQLTGTVWGSRSININLGGHTVTTYDDGSEGVGINYGIVYYLESGSATNRINGTPINNVVPATEN